MRLPIDKTLRVPELEISEYEGTVDGFRVRASADGSWKIVYNKDKIEVNIYRWGYGLPEREKNMESAKKSMFAALAKAREIKASL